MSFWVATLAAQNDFGIKGNLNLGEQWESVAYLSYIPNMNERYTAANAFIIDEAEISETGDFEFDTRFLPKEDALYRIHISKKGDPPASLIIGGRDENFQFLVLNNSKQITIVYSGDSALFQNATISGYAPNKTLQEVIMLRHFADSASFLASGMKKELIEGAIEEKLRLLADTCSHALVSLFALYESNFEVNKSINTDYYADYLARWRKEDSPYFKVFKNQFPQLGSKSNALIWPYLFVGLIVGFAIAWLIFKPRYKLPKTDGLSIQEKKIYLLLKEGKSNKEISEEFSIGLSTVKSHVSNILNKVGAKSRKELMNVH